MHHTILSLTIILCIALTSNGQCPVSIDQSTTVSPSCAGECDGGAEVSVSGSGNISYQWFYPNNDPIPGATSAIVTGLCSGDHYVEVTTDAGGGSNTVYEDDFEGNVNWTLDASTGLNEADANIWTVGQAEGGVAPPGCGVANNGNQTLHITPTVAPNLGALYNSGGLCPDFFCVVTNVRAESPLISTIGSTGLTLSFDYISMGDLLTDNASVWYNDGSGWTELTSSIKSVNCPGGQGEWTSYSQTLPASCEDIPNLQIGINWTNNDDGVGSDPSVAINDLMITTSGGGGSCTVSSDGISVTDPAPILIQSPTTGPASCVNVADGSISMTSSGGTPPYSFSIDGGATFGNTSGVFTGLSSGTYYLGVMDSTGCTQTGDSVTVGVAAQSTPSISGSAQYCEGSETTLTATAGYSSYNWLPGNLTTQTVTVTAGTYVVLATDLSGCTVSSDTVTVVENPNPTPIIVGDSVVCENATVILSAPSGYSGYIWEPGGQTTASIDVGAGSFTVTVTDSLSCSGSSESYNVSELQFTPVNIQVVGDSLFIDPSIGTGFQWHIDGSPIPGGVNSYYIAEGSGEFTVYYVDQYGCVHFTNGIAHNYIGIARSMLNDLHVYPNPANNTLYIEGDFSSYPNPDMSIMDSSGRTILKINSVNKDKVSWDISSLNSGVYVLRIQLGSKISNTVLVVI